MRIDEPRHDVFARNVDHALRLRVRQIADGGDAVADNAHVRAERVRAGAVHDGAAAQYQIKSHGKRSFRQRG